MHRHLLLFSQTTFGSLQSILHRVSHLTDSALHLVHADEPVEILQDIIDSPFLRHIALDVITFHLRSIGPTADKLRKDILSGLIGQMTIAEEFVLGLNLILEVARELVLGLLREFGDAVFRLQVLLTDVRQFMITWCRKTECVFEAVDDGRVALKEILQTLRQSGDHHNGIILPFVHLDKEFIKRVHLIGLLVWQEFLHIVEEQNSTLGFLDIIVPLVNKPLIVYCIDHRQFRLLYDLMFVEIVTKDLSQHGLTRSRLTDDDDVDGDPDVSDVLTGLEIGVGIDDGLQLSLHIVKSYQPVKQVLIGKRTSTPLAELRYASVFLMTILTNHYSTSFCNCLINSVGDFILLEFGLLTFIRAGLKMMKLSTKIRAMILHST